MVLLHFVEQNVIKPLTSSFFFALCLFFLSLFGVGISVGVFYVSFFLVFLLFFSLSFFLVFFIK